MDKIGWDGVKAELVEAGFSADSVAKYVDMFGEMEASEDPLGYLENKLTGVLVADVIGEPAYHPSECGSNQGSRV